MCTMLIFNSFQNKIWVIYADIVLARVHDNNDYFMSFTLWQPDGPSIRLVLIEYRNYQEYQGLDYYSTHGDTLNGTTTIKARHARTQHCHLPLSVVLKLFGADKNVVYWPWIQSVYKQRQLCVLCLIVCLCLWYFYCTVWTQKLRTTQNVLSTTNKKMHKFVYQLYYHVL